MYERNNVVRQFEKTIAKHCGAPYGIAVESCSAALLLYDPLSKSARSQRKLISVCQWEFFMLVVGLDMKI